MLGSLLIDPDAIIKVANFLRVEDFFRERHGWLYDVMLTLHERREPLDFVTVVDELERRGQLEEIGGPAYITDLIGGTPTSINVDFYARIVERTALLRRLISAAGADRRAGLRREPGSGRGDRPRRDADLWRQRSPHPSRPDAHPRHHGQRGRPHRLPHAQPGHADGRAHRLHDARPAPGRDAEERPDHPGGPAGDGQDQPWLSTWR